jgi:hypothetical protein
MVVSEDEQPSMRDQLAVAREKIGRQLEVLYARTRGRTYLFRPDFRENIAELEAELREIDALLAKGGQDQS